MDEGIVDLSDDLRVERLVEAYSFGIFPWPHQDLPTIWFCPEARGVLDFSQLHVSRSLRKVLDRQEFHFTMNRCFDLVMSACAQIPRPGQDGSWITEKLLRAYRALHRAGYAHSLEVWHDKELVGGLYGVYIAGVFSGESMFFLKPNASKAAVVRMVEFLKEHGLEWMDIQMVTPVLEKFGGKYITRDEFWFGLRNQKNGRARSDLLFKALAPGSSTLGVVMWVGQSEVVDKPDGGRGDQEIKKSSRHVMKE
jgi:leucyl/phenylalanyl-tRNA--protein transferase